VHNNMRTVWWQYQDALQGCAPLPSSLRWAKACP
jgi:hypothetical protein